MAVNMFSGFGKQLGGMIGKKVFGTEEAGLAGGVAGEVIGKAAGKYFSGKDVKMGDVVSRQPLLKFLHHIGSHCVLEAQFPLHIATHATPWPLCQNPA